MDAPELTREQLRKRGEEVRRSMKHALGDPPDGPLPTSQEMGHYSTEAIFGSVWGRPGLERRERMLATLAILTTLQRMPELRIYIETALNIGLEPIEIQEVLIHCSIYAGQPATVNALAAMRQVFEARGVAIEQPVIPEASLDELEARGRELRERLLGSSGTTRSPQRLAPGLQELLLRYVFGEIFQRPGLDLKSRVICAISALIALRANSQLTLYANAYRRAGLSREELIEVMLQAAPYAGFPAALNALALLDEHDDQGDPEAS
jgi:4-carboxymuconolactone decarboxylase